MACNIATDDSSASSSSKFTASGIMDFPCDLPSQEQLREWLPHLTTRIDSMGLSAYLRGSEPSYVIQYTLRDLALTPELPATAGEGPKEARLALRATYDHDNSIKISSTNK